jgi:hypothetical protein
MIQALRDAGGNPKYTEIANGGHVIWDPIYQDASHTLYPWLFAQSRPAAAPGVGAVVSGDAETAVVRPITPVTPAETTKKPAPPVKVARGAFSEIPVKPEKRKRPIVRKSEAVFNAPAVKPKATPASKLSVHHAAK